MEQLTQIVNDIAFMAIGTTKSILNEALSLMDIASSPGTIILVAFIIFLFIKKSLA